MQAFARNCRNQCSDGKGEAQATKIVRRVPKRSIGTDRSVLVMKAL
jgi:hypothetical protein